jgi:hypothetical protein
MRKVLLHKPPSLSYAVIIAWLAILPAYPGNHGAVIGEEGMAMSDASGLAANVAPVLTNIETDPLYYTSGSGAVVITNTLEVSDADNANLTSATVSIITNYKSSQDRLRFTNANNITGSFNVINGVLTLTGKSSVANYQAALRSVKYENTNTTTPNTSERTVQFRVYDGAAYSRTVSRKISYLPTAAISGGGDLCGSWQIAPIVVSLTGMPSWTITVRRSGGPAPLDTTIKGIRATPFSFQSNIAGTYTLINVADKNFASGIVKGTAAITYDLKPKAVISGQDTTCSEEEAILLVNLDGMPPYSITYLHNGGDARTVNDITNSEYILRVTGDGLYTLYSVSDQNRSGCVSGSGTVLYYAKPAALVSGSTSICRGETASLQVNLTGTPPWSFGYRRNDEPPFNICCESRAITYLPVNQEGHYTLTDVSDIHCTGTVSGSAQVTVKPSPDVTISGLLPAYKIDTGQILVTGSPAGGTFSGHGLYSSEGKTYFFPSAAGLGVHPIVYTYIDPGTGCYGYDTVQVAVLLAEATITFPGDRKFFCFNEAPFVVRADNIENSIGHFSISGGAGLTDNHDNTATIDPSKPGQSGEYILHYSYFRQGVWMSVHESFEIEYTSELRFIGFDRTTYCDNENAVKLNGNMSGGVFSGKAVYGNPGMGFFYQPSLSVPGPDTVYYSYTTTRGCALSVFSALVVLDAPNIDFTTEDSCVYSGSKDSIIFINRTTCQDSIVEWSWNFNDSGTQNTSTLKNPRHHYTEAQIHLIKLSATSLQQCMSSREIIINFGDAPAADFKWTSECFHAGQAIELLNTSGVQKGIINYNKWEFCSAHLCDSSLTQNAVFACQAPGDYEVILYVRTNYGCRDTSRKLMHIRPTYEMSGGSSYFEGFESGMAGWASSSDTPGVNSWTLGDPAKDPLGAAFTNCKGGKRIWYTRFTPVQENKEQSSYIVSPCFSFTGMQRPMIRFDLWRLFDGKRDGAVLQYTTDKGIHWYNAGGLNDGIKWYNTFDISGRPGGNSYGWSNIKDRTWVEARHSLDELRGLNDIQFRIAYGSDGTATDTYGLAFDNVWIGDRKKTTLMEHFTNTSDAMCKTADAELDALANSNPMDILDIQYHTSFPGNDPFNEQNKVDPRSRAALYQISDVPVTILNGDAGGNFHFDYSDKPLDTTLVKIQSLFDPLFSMHLSTNMMDEMLTADAELVPLDTITDRLITLHMAILEHLVTGVTGSNGDTEFESVLKTMLPDTSFSDDWYPGQGSKTISRKWSYKNTYNTDELRVVAFLQDENTGEVYQAAIDQYDIPLGINQHEAGDGTQANHFMLYPNPACNEVYIRFDDLPDRKSRADLYDSKGNLVYTIQLNCGALLHSIPVAGYPEGLYFMRITSENTYIGLQKLILVR